MRNHTSPSRSITSSLAASNASSGDCGPTKTVAVGAGADVEVEVGVGDASAGC